MAYITLIYCPETFLLKTVFFLLTPIAQQLCCKTMMMIMTVVVRGTQKNLHFIDFIFLAPRVQLIDWFSRFSQQIQYITNTRQSSRATERERERNFLMCHTRAKKEMFVDSWNFLPSYFLFTKTMLNFAHSYALLIHQLSD